MEVRHDLGSGGFGAGLPVFLSPPDRRRMFLTAPSAERLRAAIKREDPALN